MTILMPAECNTIIVKCSIPNVSGLWNTDGGLLSKGRHTTLYLQQVWKNISNYQTKKVLTVHVSNT